MKKNKYLHRFVALVMTAVMLLSLVVIDNRIGMKAEDEYTKEVINLETYIPQKVTYKKNKDGSVKTGSVEEVEISVSNNNGGFSLLEVILAMAILAIISHSAAVLFYAVHEVQCDDGGQTACNQSGAGSAGGFKKPKRAGCGDDRGRLSCSLSGKEGLHPCSVRLRRLPLAPRHFRRRSVYYSAAGTSAA